jgi:hypothetical protein
MTVRANSASSPISNPGVLKYIFPLGTSTVFVFLVISLPYPMTNDFGNLFLLAEAQSSITTAQGGQNANEAIQTFYIDGAIGSLVSDLLNPTTTVEENVTRSYHHHHCSLDLASSTAPFTYPVPAAGSTGTKELLPVELAAGSVKSSDGGSDCTASSMLVIETVIV